MPNDIPSEIQVLEWMETLSNWGRWGDDDQMGCPNLITPAKRQPAASLVLGPLPNTEPPRPARWLALAGSKREA